MKETIDQKNTQISFGVTTGCETQNAALAVFVALGRYRSIALSGGGRSRRTRWFKGGGGTDTGDFGWGSVFGGEICRCLSAIIFSLAPNILYHFLNFLKRASIGYLQDFIFCEVLVAPNSMLQKFPFVWSLTVCLERARLESLTAVRPLAKAAKRMALCPLPH